MIIFIQGECSRCGEIIHGDTSNADDGTANLFLTVPGRGAFANTIFKAELICKNAQLCAERQHDCSA